MKLRAIGAGSAFARWPLIAPCWLIQTHSSLVLINCPPSAPARLEALNIPLSKIDMILPLAASVSAIGGLDEMGHHALMEKRCPYLAGPTSLLRRISEKIDNNAGFQHKYVQKVGFKEEHLTETFNFVDNMQGSYGFRLETAKVFCSGSARVDEDWLFKNMDCDILLHEEREELQALPVYMQNKIWVYGYSKPPDGTDPLPMLYLPQGSWVYDSDRRDKVMAKERYIRENSKRTLGNESSK
jgi:hypothetical protein